MVRRSRCVFLLFAVLLVMTSPGLAADDDSSSSSSVPAGLPLAEGIAQVPQRVKAGPFTTSDTVTTYLTGAITKPSTGRFSYWPQKTIWQTNGTGWGHAAEYRMRVRGENYAGVLFSDTPTNSTLYVPGQKPFTWSIHRYECDFLWTRQFIWLHGKALPYVSGGTGAILLNGGRSESGWDGQGAIVGGAGTDARLSRLVTLRLGFTLDSLRASTYSDRSYRSSWTVMVEPRAGIVWNFGMPHPR